MATKERRRPKKRTEMAHITSRFEDLMSHGVTNYKDLCAAFNISQKTCANIRKRIREKWEKGDGGESPTFKRTLRIKQLESIALLALNSFERSQKDHMEYIIVYENCGNCNGTNAVKKDGVTEECPVCNAEGQVEKHTRKTKGTTGDPAFLRVAKECFSEAAKMDGIYVGTASAKQLVKESRMVGGVLEEKVMEMYVEAPIDVILNAKTTMDDLRQGLRKGSVQLLDEKVAEMKQDDLTNPGMEEDDDDIEPDGGDIEPDDEDGIIFDGEAEVIDNKPEIEVEEDVPDEVFDDFDADDDKDDADIEFGPEDDIFG